MATKGKKTVKTKKKTAAKKTASAKKMTLQERLKKMNKGRVLAALLVAAIGFATQMADAKDVQCLVKVDGKVLTNKTVNIPQLQGEPEGTGSAVVAEDAENNLKVFVISYPLRVVAVLYDLDVPIKTKASNRLLDIVAKGQSSRVHTYMNGLEVDATCDEN